MPTTTNSTIVTDLLASLHRRAGVPAGLTWRDFKAAMARLEVEDEDRIAMIDYGTHALNGGRLVRDDAPDGIEIRGRS